MRVPAPLVPLLLAASLTAGCGAAGASTSSHSVNLVAYSTPQKAYADLVAAFKATAAGKGSSFAQSFGASGAQSRAVIAGQPADVVAFSLEPDLTKLVKAGLVAPGWNANPYHGMVTDSVVVLVVRKGNPKHITGWADLTRPGVKVVTPNVASSGSAKWNLLAAYGAQLKLGKSPADALGYVTALLKHTVAQPDSGSKATAAFVGGVGDVLISYENEAIAAKKSGADVDYVTPAQTILIENPVAVTVKGNATAKSFVQFLYTDAAQKIFAAHGYRPVVPADFDATQFPAPAQLFTIADLGGWSKANAEFFDPSSGSITKIVNSVGGAGG
ncbi:MAG: sulfate/thiosulfate transport system substrate-binding protein [Frankiaceae bacterium]|jgi:sulfate transport system substrate-binding protein|nr:sulfate/thiosulfate transport system substrate-binding protein [Frankiaceae bacterium]